MSSSCHDSDDDSDERTADDDGGTVPVGFKECPVDNVPDDCDDSDNDDPPSELVDGADTEASDGAGPDGVDSDSDADSITTENGKYLVCTILSLCELLSKP